jgi:hypothetical protein
MMYRETEEECNRDYEQLVSNYSEAKDYLDKNNWPHRHQCMHGPNNILHCYVEQMDVVKS